MIQEATDKNFEELIKEGVVLVDFHALWCGPCHMMEKQTLNPFSAKNQDLKILKLDIDANPMIAQKYGIQSIPQTYLFKDGKEVASVRGFVPLNKLESTLSPHLS